MHSPSRRRALGQLGALFFAGSAGLVARPAAAHNGVANASAASSLSVALPIAVLVAAPLTFLSAGALLTVAAVEVSAEGTVWLVRRASDGVTASMRLGGELVAGVSIGVGTALVVTASAAGWIISAAGEAICLVPNAIGESLLYNERIR